MTKRSIRLVTLAVAALLLPALALAEVELTVWHACRGAEQAALDGAVAAFNKMRVDDVRVELVAVPRDALIDRLNAAVPAGEGPDVFLFPHTGLGSWVAADLVLPLDPYLYEEITDPFIPATLAAVRSRGATYGLPLTFEVATMVYNTDLVKTPPRTSGELVEMAARHTDIAEGKFGLAYPYADLFYHGALMNAFGGGLFDDRGVPALNRPQNVQSLELMMAWLDGARILASDATDELVVRLFDRGEAAIAFAGPRFFGDGGVGVPYALALLPTVDEADGAPLRPWLIVQGAYVTMSSRFPDYAFDFVVALAGESAGRVLALEGRLPPANERVYADPAVAGDAVLPAFRRQAALAAPMPSEAAMATVRAAATAAIGRVATNAAPPRAALEQAQQGIEAQR